MKPFNEQEIKNAMCLYAVTDSMWLKGRTLPQVVEEAIKGGATFMQIREKNMSQEELIKLAGEVKEITDRYHVPYVVDDEVEIAKQINADGVHIGQSDKALVDARRILGVDKIIGVSVQTIARAVEAEKNGADYLELAPFLLLQQKLDADDVSLETLKAICDAVSIPVVAIGGITKGNLLKLKGTGVDGVAVVSAIFAAKDIEGETKDLLETAKKLAK